MFQFFDLCFLQICFGFPLLKDAVDRWRLTNSLIGRINAAGGGENSSPLLVASCSKQMENLVLSRGQVGKVMLLEQGRRRLLVQVMA